MYEYTRSYEGLGRQAYTRTYHGLGYSYPRGACSQVNQGERRCFRPREESIAPRAGCVDTEAACEVGGDTGASYCCPPGGLVAAPPGERREAAAPAEGERKGVWESITEWFTETGERVTDRPAPTGARKDQQPTSEGFAAHAEGAAREEAARAEMDELPIEDETGIPWYTRYQTHITIASTVIGLGAFIGWVMLKDKD
jgi:hypothetical protein